jgi:eukaryotic-like serine/threonine-protein kinase
VSIDLYCGNAVGAWERVDRAWRSFRRSLMLGVQPLRVSAHFARGRAALGAVRAGKKELLRVAARDARVLQKEDAPYAVALGTILEGGVHRLRGDHARAATVLDAAARLCEAPESDMHMHAYAVRWELGRLIGGNDGQALVAAAENALRAEGVRRPDAMVSTFTGGVTR